MEINTTALLKEYNLELNLEEKIEYDDYEGIIRAFMIRRTLLAHLEFLTEKEYKMILKYEKIFDDVFDKLLAKYPQVKEEIDDGLIKLMRYQLKKVA